MSSSQVSRNAANPFLASQGTSGAADPTPAASTRTATSSAASLGGSSSTTAMAYVETLALLSAWLGGQQAASTMAGSSPRTFGNTGQLPGNNGIQLPTGNEPQPAADPGLHVQAGGTDTRQGNLGDCGTISAINAIAAQQPGLIADRVKPLAPDAQGNPQWDVKLFQQGAWRHIRVSSTDLSQGYAQGLNGTDYGPVLEAGVIKALGGPQQATGQWTQHIMQMITGGPMVNNEGRGAQEDTLNAVQRGAPAVCEWGEHAVYDRRTGAMVGGADAAVGPNQVKILDSHAYAITAVTGQAPNRLVTVQNPHDKGPGSEGTFTLTERAFVNIFRKSGYAT